MAVAVKGVATEIWGNTINCKLGRGLGLYWTTLEAVESAPKKFSTLTHTSSVNGSVTCTEPPESNEMASILRAMVASLEVYTVILAGWPEMLIIVTVHQYKPACCAKPNEEPALSEIVGSHVPKFVGPDMTCKKTLDFKRR